KQGGQNKSGTQAKNEQSRGTAKNAGWTEEEMSRLTIGLNKFPGGTVDRWERVAAVVETRTAAEVLEKVKELRSRGVTQKDTVLSAIDKPVEPKAKFQWKQSASEIKEDITLRYVWGSDGQKSTENGGAKPQNQEGQQTKPQATNTTTATTTTAPKSDAVAWTQAEQDALQAALRKYPASLGKERWSKIAAEVPGRTAKECLDRFRYLVEYFK